MKVVHRSKDVYNIKRKPFVYNPMLRIAGFKQTTKELIESILNRR